MMFSLQQRELC